MADDPIDVRDVPERNRYELRLDGELAGRLEYRRDEARQAVLLIHAEVSPRVGGRGLGTALVRAVVDDLEAKGETIVPVCSFVRSVVAA